MLTVGDLLRLPPGRRSLAELVKEREKRGRVALKVVDQRKPEPEEEPEEPEEGSGAASGSSSAGPAVAGWDQAIAAMNRQHAIIENVGGKAVIASWEPSTIDPWTAGSGVPEQGKFPAEIFEQVCLD